MPTCLMLSRRQFVATLAAATLPFVSRGQTTKPLLHLGLVADPQYADIAPIATRFYRQSPDKLATAIDHFNGLDLDLCINCGDAIDRDWASFDAILKVFAKSKLKFNHLLGNHDFELLDPEKAHVPAKLGLTRRYYAIKKPCFCFAMLDTNDISLYAQPLRSPETLKANDTMLRYRAAGLPQAWPWNGAVGSIQLEWLEKTCLEAKAADQKVIIFSHHPILPAGIEHNAWNTDDLIRFVNRHRHVVAWINGHNHQGNYAVNEGVPYITLKGMVETKDTNAFSTMKLFADRLEITGHGREPSREIPYRQA